MEQQTYKAVLLDIDGTLLPAGRTGVSERVNRAVQKTRQKGIKIIVATGRSDFVLTKELLGDFKADYYITVNGGLITDENHCPVQDKRLSLSHMQFLDNLAQQHDTVLAYTFEDNYYFYRGYEKFIDPAGDHYAGDGANDGWGTDCSAADRHLSSMPYGAVFHRVREEVALPDAQGLTFVRFAPGSYDIYRTDVDKAEAAKLLLASLGITLKECVAIGDGNNDVPLLRAAGLGIAMANARPAALAAADCVTASAEEDGVAVALEKLFEK